MCVVVIQSERVHTYLLKRGPLLWSSATAGEHTWGAIMSTWVTSGSLPFAWETTGSLPFAWATSGSLPSVQIYRPYTIFSSPMWRYEHPLRLTYFFCLWLVIGTYILPFFPVICWSYLRTEISVTLSIGNKLYSRHHILYFTFLWKHFVDVSRFNVVER